MKWLQTVWKQIRRAESLIPAKRTYKHHLSHYQQQT
ncbi:integrase [Legionella wadsworthii]|uniref:Integrase n=1 Tax=Legionella wadsworthii TaxID=28088 RepID=A0A378LP01_9GAMM|nr:integrase [Legionella wadsworthii]